MITRSLTLLRPRPCLPAGERQRPVVGPRHKAAFPCSGTATLADLPASNRHGELTHEREQVARATASNNYWSSSTYRNNPNNAWNVNFNDGNVNADNKNNGYRVRAVRGGL